jgi:hypothetical protein
MSSRMNGHAPSRLAVAALVALAICAPVAARAAEGWFETARGRRVETPPVEGLDCPALAEVLRAIDDTGYRKGKRPLDRADAPLLAYEHAVAESFFARCARRAPPPPATADDDAGASAEENVFRDGYE